MFTSEMPLWNVTSIIKNEEFDSPVEAREKLRVLRKEITAHNNKHHIPQEHELQFKMLEVTAGEKIAKSWQIRNEERPVERKYVQILRVKPVVMNDTIRRFLPANSDQTQFALTQAQVDAYLKLKASPRIGSIMSISVEFWKAGVTQYLRLSKDFKSIKALQDAFATDPTDVFEVKSHEADGISYKQMENFDPIAAQAAIAAQLVAKQQTLLSQDFNDMSAGDQGLFSQMLANMTIMQAKG